MLLCGFVHVYILSKVHSWKERGHVEGESVCVCACACVCV